MKSKSGEKIRIALLWTRLSGYVNACLRQLAEQENAEIFVNCFRAVEEAPFDNSQFSWLHDIAYWTGDPDESILAQKLDEFRPDILIFSGWHLGAYRRIARRWSGRCLRVMAIDNCWNSTFKQFTAATIGKSFVRSLADFVWLPGERQAEFARKLGFSEDAILRGLYACDQTPLAKVHQARINSNKRLPSAFIYVGRLVPQKGIATLAAAYQGYREAAPHPWPLYCYGDGPEKHRLEAIDGIQVAGFCQPDDLPSAFARAACLILPSNFEPWAVVVHEATTAGLIVLASNAVGAAVHLVQPGYNGYIFACTNAEELKERMLKISAMLPQQLDQMSHASYALSHQYSPALWTATLKDAFESWSTARL